MQHFRDNLCLYRVQKQNSMSFGQAHSGKKPTNLLAVPSGYCSFSDLQQTITKINRAQPHTLRHPPWSAGKEGLCPSQRMLTAQGLGAAAPLHGYRHCCNQTTLNTLWNLSSVYSGIYSFAMQAHKTHAVKHRENVKSQLFCQNSLSRKYKAKRSLC